MTMSDEASPPEADTEALEGGFFTRVKNPVARPGVLTFICLMWIVVIPMLMLTMIRPGPEMANEHAEMVARIPRVIPIMLSLLTGQLFGLVGVWFMKKWGVLLYSFAVLGNIGFYLANGLNPALPLVCVVNMAVFWGHFKRML